MARKSRKGSCWRRTSLAGDMPGDGVNHDDLPPQFPGIVNGCAGAAAPYSVKNGQQQASRFYQPVVPVDHAAVIVLAAHIVNRISLFQNRMIPFPR